MGSPVATCRDSGVGVDLVPARTYFLLRWMHHGPGFSKEVEYRVGPSNFGPFNALWVKGESLDENPMSVGAWTPKASAREANLRPDLYEALLASQRDYESVTRPNANSVSAEFFGLLTASEISRLVTKVFNRL